MSGSAENYEWYLARDGQQFGPVSEAELRKVIEFRHLRADDLVWRAGFEEWQLAGTVFPDELANAADAEAALGEVTDTPVPDQDVAEQRTPDQEAPERSEPAAVSADADDAEVAAGNDNGPAADAPADSGRASEPSHLDATSAANAQFHPQPPASPNDRGAAPAPSQQWSPQPAPAHGLPGAHQPSANPHADWGPHAGQHAEQGHDPGPQPGPQSGPGVVPAPGRGLAPGPQPGHQSHQHRPVSGDPGAPQGRHGIIAPQERKFVPGLPEPEDLARSPHPQLTPHARSKPHPRDLDWNAPPTSSQRGGVPRDGDDVRGSGRDQLPVTADLNFDPEFENEFGDPPRRRSALATVAWSLVAATFIGLLSAGGWFAYTQNEAAAKLFRQLSGAAATRSEPAIVSAPRDQARFPAAQTSTTRPENAAGPQPAARPDAGTVATATPAAQVTPAPPPPKPPMALLTTQLWQQLETHFPDWSSKVAADVSRQREEQKDDAAIGAEVIQALVRLRRNNATAALSAPPRHLTAIAQGFVDNLRFLRQSSIEACYGFIAEGEMNSAVLPLLIEPAQSGPLPKQSIAIVQAIAASRTEPTKYAEPTKADFDALSRELVKRGWSRDDLRLFSDPAALSKAQHDQVCRLVLEWFETQISLPDGAQKLRLLNASLSPVVAG